MNSGSSRDPEAIHLKTCLAFVEAKWQFHLFCQQTKGRDNTAADALSRNRLTFFHDVYPQAREEPTEIQAAVLDQARLDLRGLDKSVDRLFREGLAPSTARTYGAGKKRYKEFCSLIGDAPTEKDGIAHSTVKRYLAAVRHLHLEEGKADPGIADMAARLQLVVGGEVQPG